MIIIKNIHAALQSADVTSFNIPLLDWYEKNKRPLPWRENPAPYPVWVSEAMAQQTRIAQMLSYYARFMEHFPTVEALANATEDEVLSVWAGMGYYARARNLRAAARIIVSERAGIFPQTRAEWESLPGVGAYMAAAIASIAYGRREAAVDGNALRVYARLNDDDTDISLPATKKKTEDFWLRVMPEQPMDVSRFTQAVMELGALVCVPGAPLCGACPLSGVCLAKQNGNETERPVKGGKKEKVSCDITVLLIIDPSGRVLTRRRTESLLKGMWIYSLCDGHLPEAEARAAAMGWGYTVRRVEPLGDAAHIFTHRIWRMTGYAVFINEAEAPEGCRFMTPAELNAAALPQAVKHYTAWYNSINNF